MIRLAARPTARDRGKAKGRGNEPLVRSRPKEYAPKPRNMECPRGSMPHKPTCTLILVAKSAMMSTLVSNWVQ
jgi:hypothetical protein